MSILKVNSAQIGQSLTATNNFTWYQPSSPDGTVRLGNGNAGATSADLLTVNSSGNVGIGIAPTGLAGTRQYINGASIAGIEFYINSARTAYFYNSASGSQIGTFANTNLALMTNDTVRATLDTSGNLGLGVTPSASWQSTRRVLQVGGSAALWATSGSAGSLFLSNNVYFDGTNFRYLNTSGASYLAQSTDGSYSFNQAASGTAGNAISFTQAMTLDASGNLGVGTSSPGAKLDVVGSVKLGSSSAAVQVDTYSTTNWNYSNLNLRRNASNTSTPRFLGCLLDGDADTSTTIGGYPAIWGIYSGTPTTGSTSSGLSAKMGLASYAGFNFYTNGTQAMTLDASGNLGLGVTPSGWNSSWKAFQFGPVGAAFSNSSNAIWSGNEYLNSGGTPTYITSQYALRYRQDVGSGYHAWFTAPSGTAGNAISFTQAMTLDASGNLLVGGTSNGVFSARLLIERDLAATNQVAVVNNILSGNVYGIINSIRSNGNNTSSYHFSGVTQGVNQWYLYGNGTSSFTSDQRKKKNIETTRDGYLEDICKLRVVKYNWWNDEDATPKELGLIAQEVETVFPGLITDAIHPDIDGETYKVLKGSVLPFMLLKAIQELSAELNELKKRIN